LTSLICRPREEFVLRRIHDMLTRHLSRQVGIRVPFVNDPITLGGSKEWSRLHVEREL